MTNGTVLYLAGPMSGLPNHNADAFRAAASALRAAGYVVISPVELDEKDGIDLAAEPGDWDWANALARDLTIVTKVDGVATLPGSEKSRGAYLETTLARALGKAVNSVDAWIDACIGGYERV